MSVAICTILFYVVNSSCFIGLYLEVPAFDARF